MFFLNTNRMILILDVVDLVYMDKKPIYHIHSLYTCLSIICSSECLQKNKLNDKSFVAIHNGNKLVQERIILFLKQI